MLVDDNVENNLHLEDVATNANDTTKMASAKKMAIAIKIVKTIKLVITMTIAISTAIGKKGKTTQPHTMLECNVQSFNRHSIIDVH